MVSPFSRHLATTAALAATLVALPALAQQQPQQPPAPPATAGTTAPKARPQGSSSSPAERHQRHEAHRAQRMAALKDQLKLTPAQEPAWAAFTTAMQPGERPARLDPQGLEKLTTPERIDRMRALRAQHAADADRRGEATKTFYAALTPEQQKTFDAQAHLGHRMGHMGHMGDMKGMGGGHHPKGRPGMRGGEGGRPPQPTAAPAQ